MYQGPNRKLNRWQGYDYNQSGFYFITICTLNRIICLGDVKNDKMVLNDYGKIVNDVIIDIPNHYGRTFLDIHQVMPNHVHLNIFIGDQAPVGACNVGTEQCSVPTVTDLSFLEAPTGASLPRHYGQISKIIKSFKEATVKEIRKNFGQNFSWQRSFYDRIVRDESELYSVREYIKNNPSLWAKDRNNPKNFNQKNPSL